MPFRPIVFPKPRAARASTSQRVVKINYGAFRRIPAFFNPPVRNLVSLFVLGAAPLSAQVLYATPGEPYAQNFSHPDAAGSDLVPWVDNETFRGWFAAYFDGKSDVFETPTGIMPTAGIGRGGMAFYLYRTDADPLDAALGAQPTDQHCPGIGTGGIFYGFYIVNATGQTLRTLRISYRVEQYRVAATPERQITLTAGYRVGGHSLAGGNWTVIPESIYTTPIAGEGEGGTSRTIDGNLAEHVVAMEDLRVEGLVLAPGQSVWIRWFDVNNRSTDHGVGVDDVQITLEP
jgi:hypothetical protein